jgi:hypothetical protein
MKSEPLQRSSGENVNVNNVPLSKIIISKTVFRANNIGREEGTRPQKTVQSPPLVQENQRSHNNNTSLSRTTSQGSTVGTSRPSSGSSRAGNPFGDGFLTNIRQ